MSSKFNQPSYPSSSTHSASAARDSRTDLGYGTTKPKYHLPRQSNDQFPYKTPDQYDLDDIEIDDETLSNSNKGVIDYHRGDPYANNKNNPFYFVAGNTKLSDCFWKTDSVLLEIASFGDSMSPMPHAVAGRSNSLTGFSGAGGYPGAGGTNPKRTGSYQGWSKAPPQSKIAQKYENEIDKMNDFEDNVFYTVQDLIKIIDDNE